MVITLFVYVIGCFIIVRITSKFYEDKSEDD